MVRKAKDSKDRFSEPSWAEPLDVEGEIEAIPSAARIRGMFVAPVALEAKRVGLDTAMASERYVGFQFYPLRMFARLLTDTSRAMFPARTLRSGLRKFGRSAPKAFIASTLGKVVLGSAQGVRDSVAAMAKAYELSLQPGRAVVSEQVAGENGLIVTLEDVHYFLDCHHIGIFEGAMAYAGVRGRVKICKRSSSSADLLLQW
jgi:uncharacterized protein (TIGR02265 family)